MNNPLTKVPAGGWKWEENGFFFDAETPQKLAAKVAEYRENNRMPKGDALMEIFNHYGAKIPGFIGVQKVENSPDELLEAVRAWLVGIANRDGGKFATVPEIVSRAAICVQCPMNQVATDDDIERRVILASRGLSMAYPALKACGCHRHHNRVAVLLKDLPVAVEGQPVECWIK